MQKATKEMTIWLVQLRTLDINKKTKMKTMSNKKRRLQMFLQTEM